MKRFFLFLAGVIGLLAIAAAVIPFLIPKEVYKERIETAATAALGRDVVLEGDIGLSLFPRIAATVEDVLVANPEGDFDAENMIEAGALRASVKWGPLLARRIEVQEIAFEDAVVSLQRLPNGEANWEFGTGAPAEGGSEPQSVNAGVEQARITNATLTVKDAITGQNFEFTDLNARGSVQSFDEPLSIDADGVLNGRDFDTTFRLDSPNGMLAGESAALTADLASSLGEVSFDGSMLMGEAMAADGAFSIKTDDIAALFASFGLAAPLELAPLGGIDAEGSIAGPISAARLSFTRLRLRGDLIETSYIGDVAMGETPTLDGDLSLDISDLGRLTTQLGVDAPLELTPLGGIEAEGSIAGPLSTARLSFSRLRIKGDLIETSYTGDVAMGETPTLNGDLSLDISDAGRLATQLGLDVAGAAVLQRVDFSAAAQGPISGLALSGVDAAIAGPRLNASYQGDLSLAEGGPVNGRISASSDDLRGLVAALGGQLPPGETLRRFSVSGAAAGTMNSISLSGARLELDDVVGTGSLGLRLAGARPKVIADLSTNAIDLTPFLGESASGSTAWSDAPLDLAGLRLADAELKLSTPSLTIGDFVFTDAVADATLSNGDFNANVSRFKSFGGDWSGRFRLNAARATPSVELDFDGQGVRASEVVDTFAGLDVLTGAARINLTSQSSGSSIKQIMDGLQGDLTASLADGAIRGLNAAALVRSVQEALTTGAIPSALSPNAETDFTSLNTALRIDQGIGQVLNFDLVGPALTATGTGRIDLGAQTLDMRISAKSIGSIEAVGGAIDLGGLGVPLRLSGPWLSPTPSFDTEFIAQQLQRQAISRATGGAATSPEEAIGGLINQAISDRRQENAEDDQTEDDEDNEEDEVEALAREALEGLIFGRRNN
ncbi:MAG: AsmA family protein [Pseudomonadota bacterium]